MRQVLLGLLLLGLAGAALYLLGRSTRPWIHRRLPARICGRCGKVLRSGRSPVILSRCPPNDPACERAAPPR